MSRGNDFVFTLPVLAGLLTLCDVQVSRGVINRPPDGDAFFALRSCHQHLHGDSGEFFSPDYLCSNPPLWCNWTIRVDPGKRVHLHLEDLTPDDACQVKQDQVHVEDPAKQHGGHKVLLKCWREAKFTSSSNALEVVLLIGGWPSAPYRGFYGRYRAFGPPVVYNPQGGLTEGHGQMAPGLGDSDLPADSDLMFDYYNQQSDLMPEQLEEDEDAQMDENHHPASTSLVSPSTLLVFTPARSGRGAAQAPPGPSDSTHHPTQQHNSQNHKLGSTILNTTGWNVEEEQEESLRGEEQEESLRREEQEESLRGEEQEESLRGEEQEESLRGEEQESDSQNETEVSKVSVQLRPSSAGPEPEQSNPPPNLMELLSQHRGNPHVRNHSDSPHFPGDHLFEVAVEVNFSPDLDESWDHRARSLLLSVKTLINDWLKVLHAPLTMSSKRIKRLNAGALFILWLQIGRRPGEEQVHGSVHAALQGLIAVNIGGVRSGAVIMSVSTADVNECGTQLVLCDANADCVNGFGSYSCRCRPGFQDASRLGSGGTVCVDIKTTGCSSGLSTETKGVYVLFFLLSSLVLMLLAAAGLLYHRHHRGAFKVRCHSTSSVSASDPGNSHHLRPVEPELPPPPPPAHSFREGWPAVELPLLRFSSLLPADGYRERQGGKM